MDKTRCTRKKRESSREEKGSFCVSPIYGQVVQAYNNHNSVTKLYIFVVMYKVGKFSTLMFHVHLGLCYSCVKEEYDTPCSHNEHLILPHTISPHWIM
jgi:hypothetical protein